MELAGSWKSEPARVKNLAFDNKIATCGSTSWRLSFAPLKISEFPTIRSREVCS